ncbi:sensor domain-containing protein [Mycobacterium sp. CPCC 205710]|uniref:Sensor domain-containing protein n=1 Tax=Mycobacterium deserti TaxID=2978347 RepID=A0ABT2MDR1_9MYCO|nr:sensor domain-containing protein [Mycobacterium deserti]
MRPSAAAGAVLSACAALAGCSGTPAAEPQAVTIAEAAKPAPSPTLDSVLPTADELSSILGAAGFMGQLVDGGADMLLQGVKEADATPADCVSTGYRLQKVVYQSSPVLGVASRPWAGGDASGPSASGYFGAVEFATADDAQAFFAASADKWHRCNGQTLVLHQAGREAQGSSRIADVVVDDRIVSAVVMHDDGSTIQRALGFATNHVVDVEVSDVAGASGGAPDAVAVANLMLQKVGTP